jgi:hypothetical protein
LNAREEHKGVIMVTNPGLNVTRPVASVLASYTSWVSMYLLSISGAVPNISTLGGAHRCSTQNSLRGEFVSILLIRFWMFKAITSFLLSVW